MNSPVFLPRDVNLVLSIKAAVCVQRITRRDLLLARSFFSRQCVWRSRVHVSPPQNCWKAYQKYSGFCVAAFLLRFDVDHFNETPNSIMVSASGTHFSSLVQE
jgi:hypothetical protein